MVMMRGGVARYVRFGDISVDGEDVGVSDSLGLITSHFEISEGT